MPLENSRHRKLLAKCLKTIDWNEHFDPDADSRGRIALVFCCPGNDYEDDPRELINSRVLMCRWDVDRLSGATMWMEWDSELEGWHGPVEDVVGWSWLP
jgi:hypothetical protein